jgi:hypothetical protein
MDSDCVFPAEDSKEREDSFTDDTKDRTTLDGLELSLPKRGRVENNATSNKRFRQSSVMLSGLLNAIDGVSSQEGCILIASR